MKNNLKKIFFIGLFLVSLLTISFGKVAIVNAKSVNSNTKQVQTIPYPNNDEAVVKYLNTCHQKSLEKGLNSSEINQHCVCTLNKLYDDYEYHNSRINITHFRHIRQDAEDSHTLALQIMEDANYDCLVEEDLVSLWYE